MDLNNFIDQEVHGTYVDGHFLTDGSKKIKLISPVTKKTWKILVQASVQDVQGAIASASHAFHSWRAIPSLQRGEFLRRIGLLLKEHRNLFVHLMTMEMGKTQTDGIREVEYAAGYFDWFAGEAERIYGLTIPANDPQKRLFLTYEPVGVCGLITPWNFPLAMAARKISAALAAGCTVVAKPSNESPLTLLALAYLINIAKVPPGVFNCVVGPEKLIGKELLEAFEIRKISFTGSSAVGKFLYAQSATTLKKLTLELGGNAPFIVLNDADIKKAAAGAIAAKYRNNGQTCIAPNRFLVQKKIYPSFRKHLINLTKKLKVGDPIDPKTDLTNILHPSVTPRINKQIKDAISKGATRCLGGKYEYEPTILDGVSTKMKIFHEETFGPVTPLTPFDTLNEAIQMANQTPYGLAAYAFTENLSSAYQLMERLQYGIIGLNDPLPSAPQASFGGIKESGFGREGGPTGIYEYLNEKYLSIKIH